MASVLKALINEAERNETIRRMYARPNCRHCFGRGVERINISLRNVMFNTQKFEDEHRTMLCTCVTRAIKKEIQGGQNSQAN